MRGATQERLESERGVRGAPRREIERHRRLANDP